MSMLVKQIKDLAGVNKWTSKCYNITILTFIALCQPPFISPFMRPFYDYFYQESNMWDHLFLPDWDSYVCHDFGIKWEFLSLLWFEKTIICELIVHIFSFLIKIIFKQNSDLWMFCLVPEDLNSGPFITIFKEEVIFSDYWKEEVGAYLRYWHLSSLG